MVRVLNCNHLKPRVFAEKRAAQFCQLLHVDIVMTASVKDLCQAAVPGFIDLSSFVLIILN